MEKSVSSFFIMENIDKIKFELLLERDNNLRDKLSNIINQDGENKTVGQVLTEVITLLKLYKMYKPKI